MGTLRGYDVRLHSFPKFPVCSYADNYPKVFLNIVLDEATEARPNGEKVRIGMCVIRGNSVVMLEALDRIGDDHRGGR
jgi:hypothetical protein